MALTMGMGLMAQTTSKTIQQEIQNYVTEKNKQGYQVTANDIKLEFDGGSGGKAAGDITFGSTALFNDAETEFIDVSVLDATHFVVAFKDGGNSDYGTAIVGSVSGTTITYGPESIFNSATTKYISVSALDATRFVVAFMDDGGDDYGIARIGTVTGTTINTWGTEFIFHQKVTSPISVSSLDATHFVVAYCDFGDTQYGIA